MMKKLINASCVLWTLLTLAVMGPFVATFLSLTAGTVALTLCICLPALLVLEKRKQQQLNDLLRKDLEDE